ncbi:thiamine pyrophosphate-binding protein [Thalassomonas sp. M1454]|uniref:thiamine pyrophosphate-binding protein n=1 Tax=Thalassomonas sp. M1454 TaxID=2594477 RepID=UPI00117F0DC8|nr:thiamine pyrophosphate-binding protein [Thalassomonas sp. M1454]TRX57448.1 thiamine pyrophosphate-binding protein [Thalassomonas sp. M1454]
MNQDKTVAVQVIQALKELGVQYVFGVPSGAWIDYMEAIRVTPGIEFILTSHEGGAAFMAETTGRLTGVPGVCFGTFGPGATNLSTGVGCAYLDRSPMIVLTDEMPTDKRHRNIQMNIDHQALFSPITKQTTHLEVGKVQEIIFSAAHIALTGKQGPVHIGLPQGISHIKTDEISQAPLARLKQQRASADVIERMQALLKLSKFPIIALGLRAKDIEITVRDELLNFVEKHNIPVVLTPMAKGIIDESHPCYAGVLFHALSNEVGKTHQQADLVIAIGYDEVEFNFEQWLPKAPLIGIDIEATDIDVNEYDLACDVIGEINFSVKQLLLVNDLKKGWQMEQLIARKLAIFKQLQPQNNSFGPCTALDILRKHLPLNGIMTSDVGAHLHLIGQKWLTPDINRQLMTNGWSSMGYAIPSAIAAKLNYPNTPVCAVIGDGGFLMTVGEIAVAVREKLNIVFVLFTDNDLALIRIKQEKKSNPIYGTQIREQGTIGCDNLFGAKVITAKDSIEFELALEQAFASDGPVIVEALLDPKEYDSLVLKADKP